MRRERMSINLVEEERESERRECVCIFVVVVCM